MGRDYVRKVSLFVVVCLLVSLMGGCQKPASQRQDTEIKTGNITLAAEFGPYQEILAEVNPQVAPYKVAAGLQNVENRQRFQFSADVEQKLTQNGFAVLPQTNSEFFMLYEMNRYDGIPNLVTTDSMLHNFHLFFEYLLKSTEENQLHSELKKLSQGMLKFSEEQYQALYDTSWENAAKRNLAFFAVGNRLLDKNYPLPQAVQKEAAAELKLIQDHQGPDLSPVMAIGSTPDILESLKEDYTQYIPRGHYTRSEELQNYFQTMMWYGRMTFRLKNADETRSALLMTLALQSGENLSSWENIYTITAFFAGESDDPGCEQFSRLFQEVYGPETTLKELTGNESKWNTFWEQAALLKGPAINSIPIFDPSLQPDREEEVKGFRFMGQRYTVDADIFQRLIYREVGENPQGEKRMLPKSLDIPAALGSPEAISILQQSGEFSYSNYPENMNRLQQHIASLADNEWRQNLYWNWMNTLRPLTRQVPEGYPSFMLNQAWARKELNTFIGSWTELKHDAILYAKQVYAEMGGGMDEEIDDRGYVEPNHTLYARLASLTAMTRQGLASRNLLNERDAESLQRMEQLAVSLKQIAEKELQNQALSAEDYELIRTYGGQLEHFWLEALRDQGEKGRSQLLTDNPAMLVADVATAPPDLVLEEGTGFVQSIFAVVPLEGKLRIVKGGVYSTYEFTWPAADRLTDEKWREMLYNRQTPPAPDWTNAFMVPSGEARNIMPWESQP